MYQTLTVSDAIYQQLDLAARNSGYNNIEEFIQKLIEVWQAQPEELRQRQEIVKRIDALRARLQTTYGEMPDSVELIRNDRER